MLQQGHSPKLSFTSIPCGPQPLATSIPGSTSTMALGAMNFLPDGQILRDRRARPPPLPPPGDPGDAPKAPRRSARFSIPSAFGPRAAAWTPEHGALDKTTATASTATAIVRMLGIFPNSQIRSTSIQKPPVFLRASRLNLFASSAPLFLSRQHLALNICSFSSLSFLSLFLFAVFLSHRSESPFFIFHKIEMKNDY